MVDKKYLETARKYISDFEFSESDIDNMFEEISVIVDEGMDKMLSDIIKQCNIADNDELDEICQKIINNYNSLGRELQLILSRIIQTDQIIDFIQDLLLEKI